MNLKLTLIKITQGTYNLSKKIVKSWHNRIIKPISIRSLNLDYSRKSHRALVKTLSITSFCTAILISTAFLNVTTPVKEFEESNHSVNIVAVNKNTKNIAADNAPQTKITDTPIKVIAINKEGDYTIDSQAIVNKTIYKVVNVIEGDIIQVTNNNNELLTIKLIGLDTPEVNDTNKPIECFGAESFNRTKNLVQDKNVYLISDSTQPDTDESGRLLRYVVISNNQYFLNLNLLKGGFARRYLSQTQFIYQAEFGESSTFSIDNNLGLYGQSCKCQTEKGQEVSRVCTACNIATVKLKQWDCSENPTTVDVEDTSCKINCPIYTPQPIAQPAPSYICNCNKTCPQMSSCSEAQYQLNVCGCGRRDGDNDGIACDDRCQ